MGFRDRVVDLVERERPIHQGCDRPFSEERAQTASECYFARLRVDPGRAAARTASSADWYVNSPARVLRPANGCG